MSMVICKDCERLFDSDDDPDCFVYVGNFKRLHNTETVCAACRERREMRDEAEQQASYEAHYAKR